MARKHALSTTRDEDFSKWFQAAVVESDIAEGSIVRGCMVIKPWGYAIWELMQSILDRKFKDFGHSNCYFPLFIPIDFFEKESDHIEGFAKEMAIVTHHRLEKRDGKLVPSSPLEVPLAVRPTSEMIIGESFSRWVKSYRDLPIKINQWCNVVRWEMRTRMFLRTTEFLWQEGHTAHETEEEARNEAIQMHELYYWFLTEKLRMFTLKGRKPDHEKFPGAIDTYTVEAMMQDGKALQCTTSHFLGQNFSKATGIQFQSRDSSLKFAYTTSWGATTRLIGAMIMVHGDDDGLNLPSDIAPYQIIIIPLIKGEDADTDILDYCDSIKSELNIYRVFIDARDETPQNKKWNYIRKGAPIICEIGGREVSENKVFFTKRLDLGKKHSMDFSSFIGSIEGFLKEHDEELFERSKENFEKMSIRNITNTNELKRHFESGKTGFVFGKFAENQKNIDILEEIGVTIRCVYNSDVTGNCIISGEETNIDAIFAKTY